MFETRNGIRRNFERIFGRNWIETRNGNKVALQRIIKISQILVSL